MSLDPLVVGLCLGLVVGGLAILAGLGAVWLLRKFLGPE